MNETHQQLQAAITLLETEIAACNSKERECIEKAREFNTLGRQVRLDRAGIEAKLKPLHEQRDAIATTLKAEATAKAKAEAEANAKARAAAEAKKKADEAKSEEERLRARLAEIEAEKAKG